MENNLPNRGWSAMRKILDKELPQDRKVPIFWWWTSAGVASVLLLMGVWNLNSSTKVSDSDNATAVESEISNVSELNTIAVIPDKVLDARLNSSSTLDPESIENQVVVPSSVSSNDRGRNSIVLPSRRSNTSVVQTDNFDNIKQVDIVDNDNNSTLADPKLITDKTIQNQLSLEVQQPKASDDFISSVSNLDDSADNAQVQLTDLDISIANNISEEKSLLTENNTSRKLNYYLNPAAGLNTIKPVGFTAQFSGGLLMPISSKWSLFSGLGLGFSELRHEANIALVQDGRAIPNSLSYEQSTFGQAIPLGSEVASVNLSSNLSAFVELGLRYEFNKWFVHTGVMVVNLFDIKEFDVIQSEFNVNGQMTARNFTGSEIKETFDLYHSWDIRPIVGLGYKLTPHYSLGLTYQHGTKSLTKYPIRRLDAVYTRSLLFGMTYQW